MAEEVIKTGNGAGAPHEPVKKAARKLPKKVEESKMDETQAPEVVAEVQKQAEATATEVKEAVAAAPEAAAEAVAQVQETVVEAKAPATGINKIVKDASAQVEKLPGSKQVREAVTKVADQVGNNETTQKAVRRVRDGVQQATDQVKQGAQDLEKNPLVVAAHKVLLAGIGAAALAQEEIEDFINRLIERGSIAEADGRRMAKDVLDQRRKQMERAGERAQEVATEMRSSMAEGPKKLADDLEQRIESVLARMNIPTKEEVETLTAKITALTHKVDELKKTE
ncbi:MAG: phasin family protein [Nitrososphaerales archaeon]